MKTENRILLAFLLNVGFSVFEFVGGILTGSVAIVSDAVHDMGDAAGIGISYFFEKKSKRQPDARYTYGYIRYAVIGSAVITLILMFSSVMVIYNAVNRILNPTEIHYGGMMFMAVVGVCVNFGAAYFTHGGSSLNQKAVNLHMLEDVLGWAVVLVGAIVMRFTDAVIIDPILSIGVAAFILVHAFRNLEEITDLFLEKAPRGIEVQELKEHISEIDGVLDVHHIHIWSMDGQRNYATMHVVTNFDSREMKKAIRRELQEHGIGHATLELETEGEDCQEKQCHIEESVVSGHYDHHPHH